MKVDIIEDEPKSLILEFDGTDRGVAELLKGVLMQDKDVDFVSVVKEHPEIGKLRLVLKAEKPRALVAKAAEEAEKMLDQVSSKLKK